MQLAAAETRTTTTKKQAIGTCPKVRKLECRIMSFLFTCKICKPTVRPFRCLYVYVLQLNFYCYLLFFRFAWWKLNGTLHNTGKLHIHMWENNMQSR